jgi:hypothetical protein
MVSDLCAAGVTSAGPGTSAAARAGLARAPGRLQPAGAAKRRHRALAGKLCHCPSCGGRGAFGVFGLRDGRRRCRRGIRRRSVGPSPPPRRPEVPGGAGFAALSGVRGEQPALSRIGAGQPASGERGRGTGCAAGSPDRARGLCCPEPPPSAATMGAQARPLSPSRRAPAVSVGEGGCRSPHLPHPGRNVGGAAGIDARRGRRRVR